MPWHNLKRVHKNGKQNGNGVRETFFFVTRNQKQSWYMIKFQFSKCSLLIQRSDLFRSSYCKLQNSFKCACKNGNQIGSNENKNLFGKQITDKLWHKTARMITKLKYELLQNARNSNSCFNMTEFHARLQNFQNKFLKFIIFFKYLREFVFFWSHHDDNYSRPSRWTRVSLNKTDSTHLNETATRIDRNYHTFETTKRHRNEKITIELPCGRLFFWNMLVVHRSFVPWEYQHASCRVTTAWFSWP